MVFARASVGRASHLLDRQGGQTGGRVAGGSGFVFAGRAGWGLHGVDEGGYLVSSTGGRFQKDFSVAGKWFQLRFGVLCPGGMCRRQKRQERRAAPGAKKGIPGTFRSVDVDFPGIVHGRMPLDKMAAMGRGIRGTVHDGSLFLCLPAVPFADGDKRTTNLSFFAKDEHRHFWSAISGYLWISGFVGGLCVVYGIDNGTICRRAGSDVRHGGGSRVVVGTHKAEIFEIFISDGE